MDSEQLGNIKILNWIFRPAGMMMESRLRQLIFNPLRTLQGAGVQPGQVVLEVGCGTGFFTLHAARIIGPSGRLIAMDTLSSYVIRVQEKAKGAGLDNVDVVQRNALNTQLNSSTVDKALLFGVLPFPSLPLSRLLPEMHRVLKPDGTLALWMFPVPGWVPNAIDGSALFALERKQLGVYNYRRTGQSPTDYVFPQAQRCHLYRSMRVTGHGCGRRVGQLQRPTAFS